MLLDAITALNFSVQLTIVGEGSEKAELERITSASGLTEKVRFTGNLPFGDVSQIMQQAHVCWQPSRPAHHC